MNTPVGKSEELVGGFIREMKARNGVVLATKVDVRSIRRMGIRTQRQWPQEHLPSTRRFSKTPQC